MIRIGIVCSASIGDPLLPGVFVVTFSSFIYPLIIVALVRVIHQQNQKNMPILKLYPTIRCKQMQVNNTELKQNFWKIKVKNYNIFLQLSCYCYTKLSLFCGHDMQQCLVNTMICSVYLNSIWYLDNSKCNCVMLDFSLSHHPSP